MKQFESFRLDTANECLWQNGAQIALPPKPFAVLRYLVENPGRLITHDELLDALWPETFVQPQVLRTYMLELRRLLGDDAGQPRFIQTLTRRGYCFIAPVREGADAAPASASVSASRPVHPPVPPAGTHDLAGRARELNQLAAELQLLSSGQRRVVFVSGEAGIGKTALVDAFCAWAAASPDLSIARGQCVEGFGASDEYYPLLEALRHLCASPGGEAACRTLARLAPAWLAALGHDDHGAAAAAPRSGAESLRAGELCAALEELSTVKPLILVLEDLHWADAATLNLLSALARRRAPASLMLLSTCTHRDPEGAQPCKRLKQDLVVRQLCTEVNLGPLSRTAVQEILSRRLGQEALPEGLAGFIHQHSEGNPLFVLALLEHLMAQRLLVRGADGAWERSGSLHDAEDSLPSGLAQMIELEIQRLAAGEQRILEAGSLMGIAFPAWAVAAALEQDLAGCEEACDDLARRLYFVECAGQDELPGGLRSSFYVFGHGLYREVLYRRQPPTRRAARHIRIAERLTALFADGQSAVAREVALHYEAAGEWTRAGQALRAAAEHALAQQAPAEAADLLQRALRLAENLKEAERATAIRAIHEQMMAVRIPAATALES